MRKKQRSFWWLAAGLGIIALAAAGPSLRGTGAGARNPCQEPGNLTQNCGFDTFAEHWWNGKRLLVPSGWWYFILNGSPDFRQADDTYWGAPSLWLVSDGVPFIAGIYQQVTVTPGVVYQTDIGWAAQDKPDFERKLGLDPTGGTDPLAPSVVWSRSEWGFDKWPDLTVSARATGPTMTVFVWVAHPTTHGLDSVFLDAVGLWPDTTQPAATATPKPSPTPTRRPPTRTPKPPTPTAPPTETPTPQPTATDTPSPTPTPTDTATPTATPTVTQTPTPITPTWTPYPTRTPLPTVVPVAVVLQTAEAENSGTGSPPPGEQRPSVPGRIGAAVLVIGVGAALLGLGLLRKT